MTSEDTYIKHRINAALMRFNLASDRQEKTRAARWLFSWALKGQTRLCLFRNSDENGTWKWVCEKERLASTGET